MNNGRGRKDRTQWTGTFTTKSSCLGLQSSQGLLFELVLRGQVRLVPDSVETEALLPACPNFLSDLVDVISSFCLLVVKGRHTANLKVL